MKNFNPSNTENTNDTNRYEKPTDVSLSEIPEAELLKMGDYPFLTKRTIELLTHFGTDAQKLIDKIYAAKRKVEKEHADILAIHYRVLPRLNGELWAQDLEHEVEKFVYKYRTSCHKGQPIQDLFAYFYRMMLHFWKLVLLAETVVSFSEIERLRQEWLSGERTERSVLQAIFSDKYTLAQLDHELLCLRETALEGEKGKQMLEGCTKEKVYEHETFTKQHFDAFCVTCGSFEETKRLHFSDGSIEKIPVVRFFEWHKHQGKFREYLVIPEPPTRKKRYNTQRFYLERYGFEELLPKIATIYDLNGFLIAQRNHPYQPFHWVCRRTFYRTDTQEYLTTYQLKRRRKNRWKNNQTS